MRTLYYVTGNQGKIDNMNLFLHQITDKISFKMLKLDFEEIKSDSMEDTALNKARTCFEKVKKTVVVNDAGIFIDELNGFPGVNTAFAYKTIGNQGILKLMKGKNNRKGFFQVSLAYISDEGVEKVFTGKADIEIAEFEGGELGFDWDSIVLGNGERFSDNLNNDMRRKPYDIALGKLVDFIEEQNSSSLKNKFFNFLKMNKKIYLASKSPRRLEILTNLGFEVELVDSAYEEDNNLDIDPIDLAKMHAKGKAHAALDNVDSGIILGGDTFVVLDGKVIGKPMNRNDAKNMLEMMSGKTHEVISGVCIIDKVSGKEVVRTDITKVTFIELSDEVLEKYLDVAAYADKAGSYAVQAEASVFVEKIEGSFTNIMGLPEELVLEMLKEF
jgi:septum formation protein